MRSDADALGRLFRWLVDLRLLALLFVVLWVPSVEQVSPATSVLVGVLLAAGAASAYVLLAWDRVAPWLLRHPSWLVVDVVLATIGVALLGLDSPLLLFVVVTAALGGLLYGIPGALLLTALLLTGWYGGDVLRGVAPSLAGSGWRPLLVLPVMVPVGAAAGVCLRRLLLEQAAARAAVADATAREATTRERARLAREMHDSLAKTIEGVTFQAEALLVQPAMVSDPAAQGACRRLRDALDTARQQARTLLTDLRQDDKTQPLEVALHRLAADTQARTGVTARVEVGPLEPLAPQVRFEVLRILEESVRNATAHAQATQVVIRGSAEPCGFEVVDDGRGFAVPASLTDLARAGHYGLVGMSERAAAVGAELVVESCPLRGGTRVRLSLPAGSA